MTISRKEELSYMHYDLYKDVHGFRPRHVDYDSLTEAQLEKMLADLEVELVAEEARIARLQADAIREFEQRLAAVIATGAKDRKTALRWIMDGSDARGDWDYFCYDNHLPYGYFEEAA